MSGPALGFPRVRGDVPSICDAVHALVAFSPRARGCSALERHGYHGFSVFPAYAGMFPSVWLAVGQ